MENSFTNLVDFIWQSEMLSVWQLYIYLKEESPAGMRLSNQEPWSPQPLVHPIWEGFEASSLLN